MFTFFKNFTTQYDFPLSLIRFIFTNNVGLPWVYIKKKKSILQMRSYKKVRINFLNTVNRSTSTKDCIRPLTLVIFPDKMAVKRTMTDHSSLI